MQLSRDENVYINNTDDLYVGIKQDLNMLKRGIVGNSGADGAQNGHAAYNLADPASIVGRRARIMLGPDKIFLRCSITGYQEAGNDRGRH